MADMKNKYDCLVAAYDVTKRSSHHYADVCMAYIGISDRGLYFGTACLIGSLGVLRNVITVFWGNICNLHNCGKMRWQLIYTNVIM